MKQTTALEMLKTGDNIFLTGQAGAGKTYILNQYIDYLRAHHIKVAMTASTGIAATHMRGMTIHSWSGMGIKDSFNDDDYQRLKAHQILKQRLIDTQVLIIDEISMLHAKQVDLLDEILRTVRKNTHAFGGLQVVFCGDFFQLPPIGKTSEDNKERFAFMAKAWLDADFKICYLNEQHRQTNDNEIKKYGISLNQILNQIRSQQVSTLAIDTLINTKHNQINDTCTRLYTHNANVDKINQEQLDNLDTPANIYTAHSFGDKKLIDALKKGVKAPESLTLKIGSKVMFVKNNPELDVCNGSIGTVVNFSPFVNDDDADKSLCYPLVRLSSGKTILVEPESWTTEDNGGKTLASYSQIPLCLAWAITVHKSQGMTLDAAEIDLSHTFENGQGYVALSRVRNLDGLKLLGLNHRSLWLDSFIFRADKRLGELSKQHEENFLKTNPKTIKQKQTAFIKNSGGTLKPLTHKSTQKNAKTNSTANNTKHKQITIEKTKELVLQGFGFEEIAKMRSLTTKTVLSHLQQLIVQEGCDKYHHLISDQEVADIFPIYTKIIDGDCSKMPKVSTIAQKLHHKYSQDKISLAIILFFYA